MSYSVWLSISKAIFTQIPKQLYINDNKTSKCKFSALTNILLLKYYVFCYKNWLNKVCNQSLCAVMIVIAKPELPHVYQWSERVYYMKYRSLFWNFKSGFTKQIYRKTIGRMAIMFSWKTSWLYLRQVIQWPDFHRYSNYTKIYSSNNQNSNDTYWENKENKETNSSTTRIFSPIILPFHNTSAPRGGTCQFRMCRQNH